MTESDGTIPVIQAQPKPAAPETPLPVIRQALPLFPEVESPVPMMKGGANLLNTKA